MQENYNVVKIVEDKNKIALGDGRFNVLSAFSQTPPEFDFIWPGFLAGTVGGLVSPGATGKTFFAMQAAMAVACHVTGGDLLELAPKHKGQVTYFAGEDPPIVFHRRLHAMGKHLSEDARASIAEHFIVEPVMGMGIDIMSSAWRAEVVKICKNSRLIVFDTLSRFHVLDENSNSDMAKLIVQLEGIAGETGAAVLFLHHISKFSMSQNQADQQQAARGASSLTDNARWCGFVSKMSEKEAEEYAFKNPPMPSYHDAGELAEWELEQGRIPPDRHKYKLSDGSTNVKENRSYFLRYGVSKQNHDVVAEDKWFKRGSGGVLFPVNFYKQQKKEKSYKATSSHDGFGT